MDARFEKTARSSISLVAPRVHMKSEQRRKSIIVTICAVAVVVSTAVAAAEEQPLGRSRKTRLD
jgi:beta-lactamase regulating signal transducer with metallopeptidase domain